MHALGSSSYITQLLHSALVVYAWLFTAISCHKLLKVRMIWHAQSFILQDAHTKETIVFVLVLYTGILFVEPLHTKVLHSPVYNLFMGLDL